MSSFNACIYTADRPAFEVCPANGRSAPWIRMTTDNASVGMFFDVAAIERAEVAFAALRMELAAHEARNGEPA